MVDHEKHSRMANALRALAMDAVQNAQSGHQGLPMGAADIATVLFTKIMRFNPMDAAWPDRDRFVLSAGHGSMLLYGLLYLLGYEEMTLEEIKNFRKLGSKTPGHPEYGDTPGVETTTGPLGQGLANAVGMAIAERKLNSEFGDEVVNHFTYVLASDGDLMEGVSHEAISLAGHLRLSKLIVLYDDNGITIDGPLSLTESGNALERFEAAGWRALSIDGHDPQAIEEAIKKAQGHDRPTLIACKTTIGYGSPNKAGSASAHGFGLDIDEIAATRKALGWEYPPFEIPGDVLDAWRIAGLYAASAHKEWRRRFEELDSDIRAEFERRIYGILPPDFDQAILDYKKSLSPEPPALATRKASEAVLEVINAAVPETIGGSADLTGSNNTRTAELKAITAEDFSGRYLYYGVREHGMAAAMNGMALHGGLIPYGGTFLTFSDYARPAIRLAALMGLRVIHVMSHDSIGLGEDGPTHQPVEQLAALRAIPNLVVFRPCDAVETAECWQLALNSRNIPSVLALTRQKLEPARKTYREDNMCAWGAYEIAPAPEEEVDVSLFASGSEVEIALAAQGLLAESGLSVRVVSVPCFKLFHEQSAAYRAAAIGQARLNIAVEAAVSMGWRDLIGDNGIFVGMDSFGASAPYKQLYQHFGITAQNIFELALQRLKG